MQKIKDRAEELLAFAKYEKEAGNILLMNSVTRIRSQEYKEKRDVKDNK